MAHSTRLLAVLSAAALCAASCGVPDLGSKEERIPRASLDAEAGPPLPDNSIFEPAGSAEPRPVLDTPLKGTYKPDGKSAKERIPAI